MSSNSLYPSIKINEEDNHRSLSELKLKLNQQRIEDFENDLFWIRDRLKHYNKLLNRYKKFDLGIKYGDISMSILIGITSSALLITTTAGVFIPIVVSGIFTGIPIGYSMLHGILNLSVFKRKVDKYTKIIKFLEGGKNKLFIYHQKCLEDDILTDDEIHKSKEIISDIRNKLLELKHDFNQQHKNETENKNTKKLNQLTPEQIKALQNIFNKNN